MRWMHGAVVVFFIMLVAGCGDLTRPQDFNFTTQTGVAQNSTITSNTVTIVGNQFKAKVHIENGKYSIAGGTYTSDDGEIGLNQTLTLQHTSASTISTATTTTITVGGYTTTFTSVTSDTLTFATQTDVAVSTLLVSNTLTIPSTWATSAISISGGEYSIDGGTYTSTAGTIAPGQTLTVRHTSAAANSTSTVTTVTVGSNTITFTSTTIAATTYPTDSSGKIKVTSFGPYNATQDSSGNTTFQVTATITSDATVGVSVPVIIYWQAVDSSGNVIWPTAGGTTTVTDTITVTDSATRSFTHNYDVSGTLTTTVYSRIAKWTVTKVTSTL
ncbi:hypothetical protein FO488_00560 [Geobacter sp. FeAm09]|uniref:hypothetical protein n=1 Tax=Geobacter sp. FeAm09 TaxID=2597769 RepID=UPI0011ED2455|nr:hypothetical protein [Geobacter sp. FeAm09]QEM66798.1 hypothetical protein FO488_00560 [Geobacter sp. FeAm09]